MLALAEAIDIATGKGILTGYTREPLRVLYYNAEDDQDVLDARVSALLTHYQIEQADIVGNLYAVSGISHDDFWLIGGVDGIINETLFAQLETFITTNKIDVVIFDPLQDLSRSPRNKRNIQSHRPAHQTDGNQDRNRPASGSPHQKDPARRHSLNRRCQGR